MRNDDIGLSIDMIDADRLRLWADKIRTYGPNITEWGQSRFVADELERIADCVAQAVCDIGILRANDAD